MKERQNMEKNSLLSLQGPKKPMGGDSEKYRYVQEQSNVRLNEIAYQFLQNGKTWKDKEVGVACGVRK